MNTTDQPDEHGDEMAKYLRPHKHNRPKPDGEPGPRTREALTAHYQRTEQSPAAHRLAEQMLAAAEEYQRARRAEIIAAGGDPNDDDRAALEYVHDLANYYAEHRDDPAKAAEFYDQLAAELDLADIRALRLAGEAAVAATPRTIKAARDRGMKPPRIAAELGLTPSRVYQVVRELAAAEAAEEAPPVGEYRLSSRRPAGDQ